MSITWYLVANGSTARILQTRKASGKFELVARVEHPESRKPRKELTRDRPGAYRLRMTRPGSFAGPTDPKRLELAAFARELADVLNGGGRDGSFGRLVIIAPSSQSAMVEEHLSSEVRERLFHTIDKDYTKKTPGDLHGCLAQTLPFLAGSRS